MMTIIVPMPLAYVLYTKLHMRTDQQIKADILEQLDWEAGIDASKMSISVDHGIVKLCGHVHSYYEKITVEKIARMIAGVRAVADDVQIGISSPVADGDTDAEIAAAVELIAGLKGVRRINNYITVRPSVPAADIKKEIEESLNRLADIDAENIIVEVDCDNVTLRGVVHSLAEGDEIEYVAWSVPGVAQVRNLLTLEVIDKGTS